MSFFFFFFFFYFIFVVVVLFYFIFFLFENYIATLTAMAILHEKNDITSKTRQHNLARFILSSYMVVVQKCLKWS